MKSENLKLFEEYEKQIFFVIKLMQDLELKEPDLETEQHSEWLINMNYLDSLIPKHVDIL